MSGDAVALHYVLDGCPDSPALFLGPSVGTTVNLWNAQVRSLAEHYRLVRFDTRGHGRSPVPPGPYSVADLAADVVGLADALGVERFAYAGISLGGAVGQFLAAHHPGRVTALLLCATGPSFGDAQAWRDRAARVRADGMGWLVEPTRERWFPPAFAETPAAQALLDTFAAQPPEGYAGCCDALAGCDLRGLLGRITAPTRVIAGAEDPVSGPDVAHSLVEGIPTADLVVLDGVSHIVNLPRPDAFTGAVIEHLEGIRD